MSERMRSVLQGVGWLAGFALLAWGLERLTPLTGYWQIAAGVALLAVGGLRPLRVVFIEGLIPLSEED